MSLLFHRRRWLFVHNSVFRKYSYSDSLRQSMLQSYTTLRTTKDPEHLPSIPEMIYLNSVFTEMCRKRLGKEKKIW